MKRLIVNADDLGADEARNAGIFEAIHAGVVMSTSILPNGPALEDSLHRIRSLAGRDVSWGVHLNLSEGKPLSSGLRLLTGSNGSFLGKPSAQELLMRRGDLELEEEIARELAAQINVLQDAGVRIDHLDGHQHVHVFPAVMKLAVEGAKTHNIPWMRIPEEPFSGSQVDLLPPPLIEEARLFSSHAGAARAFLKGTGIRTTDHFRGLYLKGRVSLDALQELLKSLPQGLTEVMVHPGRVSAYALDGPFSNFSTTDREQELQVLLDKSFKLALLRAHVTLTSFPQVQS
jgi:predicted glycoside hydrolase/deacetylase ChbG (UPF0249 family)